MARKRERLSQSRPRHNGKGQAPNGDTPPDRVAYIEQILEVLNGQTAELQRLAAVAANGASSTAKTPPKAKNAAQRTGEKR